MITFSKAYPEQLQFDFISALILQMSIRTVTPRNIDNMLLALTPGADKFYERTTHLNAHLTSTTCIRELRSI